jgi:phenylacetate-CoA ligase
VKGAGRGAGPAERWYAASPVWLQHLLVSARGVDHRWLRVSGRVLRRELALLRETERWAPERLAQLQERRLQALLRTAFAEVPHWRDLARRLGCAPGDFRTPADLRALPFLTRAEVAAAPERFLSPGRAEGPGVRRFATSGTTGLPLRIRESRESLSLRWAYVARLRGWAGVPNPVHPRRAQFTGQLVVPGDPRRVFWRRNVPGRTLLLSAYHLSERAAPAYARALVRFAPDVVDGFPSALLALARLARWEGLALPRPRALITSAETLYPEQRAELEAAFGCPVHDQYAATEPACFWGECEHGTLHASPEYGVSEIVDAAGAPVGPGEAGDVVTTSFLNPVMPLLRYRIGDRAVRGPDAPCACGRTLPRMERVLGRDDEMLYVPDRGWVVRLDAVFKGLDGVVEARVVQEALDLVVVQLAAPGAGPEVEAEVLRRLRARLGAAVSLRIDRVEHIPRGPRGKLRMMESRVRHLYPPAAPAPAGAPSTADEAWD